MTLHNNYNEKVDGLIILGSQLFYEIKEFNLKKKTKIFMSHGTYDQVIPIMGSTQTLNFLRKKGFSVDYKEYPIGHEISLDQINELNSQKPDLLLTGKFYTFQKGSESAFEINLFDGGESILMSKLFINIEFLKCN